MAKHKVLSKGAIKLLRKVIKQIDEEPRRLNMYTWGAVWDDEHPGFESLIAEKAMVHDRSVHGDHDPMIEIPPCGTQGCIAGWIAAIAYPQQIVRLREYLRDFTTTADVNIPVSGASGSAAKALGLDAESPEIHRLFYFEGMSHHGWPARFATRYKKAKTPRGRANATIDRVEHYITTDGKE